MTKESVYKMMAEMIHIPEEELAANLESREIWDSLIRVEIIFELEERLGICLTEEELAAAATPGALCELALHKVG